MSIYHAIYHNVYDEHAPPLHHNAEPSPHDDVMENSGHRIPLAIPIDDVMENSGHTIPLKKSEHPLSDDVMENSNP